MVQITPGVYGITTALPLPDEDAESAKAELIINAKGGVAILSRHYRAEDEYGDPTITIRFHPLFGPRVCEAATLVLRMNPKAVDTELFTYPDDDALDAAAEHHYAQFEHAGLGPRPTKGATS